MTPNEYIQNVKKYGWTPSNKRLWQRNNYKHNVRAEHESIHIIENPLKWDLDKDSPDNVESI